MVKIPDDHRERIYFGIYSLVNGLIVGFIGASIVDAFLPGGRW